MVLTKEQRKSVSSRRYPFFLRASAGTGKTEVLIKKIAHIVTKQKKSLEDFAIITFTNKATDEMRVRLYKEIYSRWADCAAGGADQAEADRLRYQAEMCPMVQISTIHGFCDKILRTYGMEAGISPAFKVASFRRESQRIVTEVLTRHRDSVPLSKVQQYKVKSFILLLMNDNGNSGTVLDRQLLDAFRLDCPENEFFNEFKRDFLEVYIEAHEAIEREKAAANVLTLNDTIRLTAEILKKPSIAKKIASKYRFLFVDEFQDVDKSQFSIITSLIDRKTKVFIVGDEKQSIFRFRGADVQNVTVMRNRMEELESRTQELNENFRADNPLQEITNNVFSQEFSFAGTPISFPHQPFVIRKTDAPANTAEPTEIVYGEDIADIVSRVLDTTLISGASVRYEDIAVLCRRNHEVDVVAGKLKSKSYPVESVGGRGFFRSKEILDTYKLLNAVIYKSDEYVDELLFTDYFQSITRRNTGVDMGEFLAQMDTTLRRTSIETALAFAFEKSSILDYYREKNLYQAVANLYKLKSLSRELMNVEWLQPVRFLSYFEAMIRTRRDEDEAMIPVSEKKKGVISVSTIHKAKGLSFPIVLIPFCDTPLIRPINRPKIIYDSNAKAPRIAFNASELNDKLDVVDAEYNAMLQDELISHLEEELRILYVAMTRAEHKLILSSGGKKNQVLSAKTASWAKWIANAT